VKSRKDKEQWIMWLPTKIIKDVDDVARIYYINVAESQRWNAFKGDDELRMLTGWCWSARHSDVHRYGFKSITIAYRDAWYELVKKSATPSISKFRVIKGRRT